MNRRDLLALLGVGTLASLSPAASRAEARPAGAADAARLPFRPVPVPLPVPGDGLSAAHQREGLRQLALEDRLVVPEGYRAELLAVYGDPLGEGRFGFNNDHISFLSLGGGRALLTVNFEYISPQVWAECQQEAMGRSLPLAALAAELAGRGGSVDASSLPAEDPLGQRVRGVAAAALEDLGLGVVEIAREPATEGAGRAWKRRPGTRDRRIHGLTGLKDPPRRLRVSGPAAAVFRRPERLGHDDRLGDRVVGTFANCAGGETPWGTVLSAEENVQTHVCEAVFADGSSPSPAELPFAWDGQRLEGLGNPFALTGNKYGWMVEVDPRRPEVPPVKHSWLGRFRHEAVAVRAVAGRPLVVYSGCDRHGGHLYRFVSEEAVGDPRDPANSRLFHHGRLEAARFAADGRGNWIPLESGTRVDPVTPGHFEAFGLRWSLRVPHPDRRRPGAGSLASDAEVEAYRRRFPTLAALYRGEGETLQGAILIDAHLAASAAGATPAARPEDTVLDPTTGDLLIAFTSGGSGEEAADPAIFRGPAGEPVWLHGWVMRLRDREDGTFTWRMVATGGTPWQGGLGFSHPDNLAVDGSGNLWLTTDRPTRGGDLDVFGNNACWVLPGRGPGTARALCFATGPMECELCGPCFDGSETTLFLAVQHPGEDSGTRRAGAREAQAHRLVDRDGGAFEQLRWVPLGSNWPSGVPGRPPRPGLVAIRRLDGGRLLAG